MIDRKTNRSRIMLLASLVLLAAPLAGVAQDELPLNIRANVARAAGAGQGRTGMLQITIDRWTTDEEGETIVAAIKAGNQADIEKAMQKLEPVGKANLTGSLGLDLRVARHYPMEGGGSNIILATDRPIGIGEAMRGGQSTDYNTSLIVLNIPASGEGEGYFAGAVLLSIGASGKIETETAGAGVTKLAGVQILEKKKG
jgi:hypothetical protein